MQLALTAARVDQKNFGLWLKNWQVGQMLNALVTAQRPSGELVLRVAGQQITARADIPVQQGTQLLLEVRQLQPQVLLKIIPQSPQTTGTAQTSQATGSSGSVSGGLLRLLAPEGAQPASSNLAGTVDTLRSLQTLLPPGNGSPVQRLLASLPGLADLINASGLRRAVLSSGTFLEATLARAATSGTLKPDNAASDVKALLMRVIEQINTALQRTAGDAPASARAALLSEARRDLELVLGSITLNQLQAQPGDTPALRGWIMDIAFLLGDYVGNIHVRVDRDAPGDEAPGDDPGAAVEAAPRWRVELQLDLPELGLLLLTTHLQAETVTVELAAREHRTRELFLVRAGELRAALDGLGLEVPSLQVAPWPQRETTDRADPDDTPQRSWRA